MAGPASCIDRVHAGNPLDRIKSPVLIFALTLAYNSLCYRHVRGRSVACKTTNLSEISQHCGIYADGVRGLDCFRVNMQFRFNCTWEPGERTRGTTYTLVVQHHNDLSPATTRDRRPPEPSCPQVIGNITGSSRSKLRLYMKYNVTVDVYQDIESANCSKAVFRGSPRNMRQCNPPSKTTFRRQSGKLEVKVTWLQVNQGAIKRFRVRHRELGSRRWSEPPTRSENAWTCVLEALNATLAYAVQIQCVSSDHCSQCSWSEVHIISPELTAEPVVINVNETSLGGRSSRRLVTLTWEFPSKEQPDSYMVTVAKASGEGPREQIRTTKAQVALVLSHSAYRLQVSAVNNVSRSPASSHIVREEPGLSAGRLNVTIESNTSFTIHWGDNLIQKYVCYSAEWRTKEGKTLHMSFFQDRNNYRTLSPLPEALEPYRRYSLILHTRPDKDTCNMKSINNSEGTYATTHFYLTEGTPVGGPKNMSFTNVTLDSAVLQWLVIPEEDLRGFLLGYIICYAEYNYKQTMATEKRAITVGPQVNAYTLRGLKGGTEYEVQISGLTGAGEGASSRASFFTATAHQGSSRVPGPVVIATVFATVSLIFGTLVVERAKALLWPSIPNPRHSNALQKLGRPGQPELLESINTFHVAEGDTDSLQIVEEGKQEEVAAASAAEALLPPLLRDKEDEEEDDEDQSAEISTASGQPAGSCAAAVHPYVPADAFTAWPQVDLHTATLPVVASGYTTLEMLQQSTPQVAPASTQTSKERRQEENEGDGEKPRRSYVRQFSTNSTGMSGGSGGS